MVIVKTKTLNLRNTVPKSLVIEQNSYLSNNPTLLFPMPI